MDTRLIALAVPFFFLLIGIEAVVTAFTSMVLLVSAEVVTRTPLARAAHERSQG